MLYLLLLLGLLVCAGMSIRAGRLLSATLWLAGLSATVATLLYLLGARELAVIELSVGMALVPVLMVFAISITGESSAARRPLVPRPLALVLVICAAALLCWIVWPWTGTTSPVAVSAFADMLWRLRGLDILVQVAVIFVGAIGVLNLLAEDLPTPAPPAAEVGAAEAGPTATPALDQVEVEAEQAEVVV